MDSPPLAQHRRVGPYALVHQIGRGGMGVVYRAVHAETGAEVALKTVSAPSVDVLGAVRREILALARLDHPGVVRILDHGFDDGLPWYAMSLVVGSSLRERFGAVRRARQSVHTYVVDLDADTDEPAVVPSAPEGGRDRLAAVRVMRRLCRTLAYVHGEGVVHLDLKPENVLVTPDELPVLVDFGLAARFAGARGRDALELGASGSGTVAYMSPEQISGGEVDARADLYAVGCMLFELLTGRRPFLGKGAVVAASHLGREPVAPSSLVGGIPRELDALVLGLLAKNPTDRIGYAEDVAAALGRLGVDADMPGPDPRAYVYRSGFAGRAAARASIASDLARAERGTGRIVLLGGESGVGKTRLASEIARAAREDEAVVLLGECDPNGAGSAGAAGPLACFREPLRAIADRARARGPVEVDMVFGARTKVLAEYEPSLAALPGVDFHTDPPRLDAGAARLRVFAYLADVLAAAASHEPLLLVLDDVQWADELTIEFLRYFGRSGRLDDAPIVVVATYRDDEAGPDLLSLVDVPGVRRVDLGRLDARDVSDIVGGMLALSPPPERLCRELHRASGGNPFYVTEYLRSAVEQGILSRGEGGSWRVARAEAELAMPENLRELVARRLDDLAPAAREVLRAAAVFGRSSPTSLLLHATRRSEAETLDAVTDLIRRHALREPRPGEIEFAHDKIRETAYERIPAGELAGLHRIAAEALEARGSDDDAGTLALHWEHAGEPERASASYLSAARRARTAYANAEAERLFRAYLRLSSDPDEAATVRNELGDLLTLGGQTESARLEHEAALVAARGSGDARLEAESLLRLGVLHHVAGAHAAARELLESALGIARSIGDRGLEGEILGQLANVAFYDGSLETALAVGNDALAALTEAGNRSAAAHQVFRLAQASWKLGRIPEAEALLDDAGRIFRELGDIAGEARTIGAVGTIRYESGELEEAYLLYERALARHRDAGSRANEGGLLANIASVVASLGDRSRALRHLDEAIAIYRETGSRLHEGMALGNKGLLLQMLGRYEEALSVYEAALAAHVESGNQTFEATVLGYIGEHFRNAGRFAEAEERYDRAIAISRAAGDRRHEAQVLGSLGKLADALGRRDEALAHVDAALDIVRTLGLRETEISLLCLRANMRFALGDDDVPSTETFERALADATRTNNFPYEGRIRLVLAKIARRTGVDLEAATELADRAAEIARSIDDPADLVECLCELARLATARGESATVYVDEAAAIVGRLGLEPPAPLAARFERLVYELANRG